ncbi:MAG: NUDIX domain-containing protein [Chloroflexota bacterium]
MNIGITGIITNEINEILLIQRDDTRSWALPGGSLDQGEAPDAGVAREVQEETGLKVMPVRLVGIVYRGISNREHLQFIFRCMQSGGELQTSSESLQVNYFKRRKLPRPIFSFHRDIMELGWHHAGEAIWKKMRFPWEHIPRWLWLKLVVYPRLKREREKNGEPAYVPPPSWSLSVRLIIASPNGRSDSDRANGEIGHVWIKVRDWCLLPGGLSEPGALPWEEAKRIAKEQLGGDVELKRIAGAYVDPDEAHLTLVWEAALSPTDIQNGNLTVVSHDANEPINPFHREIVAATLSRPDLVHFQIPVSSR